MGGQFLARARHGSGELCQFRAVGFVWMVYHFVFLGINFERSLPL
jgi:hypothetical protein